jgi:VWFA-related protein
MVLVPTIVTDKSGHVSGLKQAEFTVLDNGKPQKIAYFEEVRTAAAPLRRATVNGYFSNVFADKSGARPATIILLDMVNGNNLNLVAARKQVMDYLLQMKPGTPVGLMLFTHYGLRVLYDIADDPAALIAALDRVSKKHNATADDPGPQIAQNRDTAAAAVAIEGANAAGAADFLAGFTDMAAFYSTQDRMDTVSMLKVLSRMLHGIPGRKSVVWITNGFDMERFCVQGAEDGDVRCHDPQFFEALRLLSEANVAVYSIDARGLIAGQVGVSSWGRGRVRGGGQVPMAGGDNVATMKSMAQLTGGRAYYNTNDIAGAVSKAQEDSSQFYLLAFYVDRSAPAKSWHRLAVKVDRPGVEVRARDGFAVRTDADSSDPAAGELRFATRSTTDFTELPIAVRWTGEVASGNSHRAAFELLMLPGSLSVDQRDNNHLNLDIEADAYAPGSPKVAGQLKRTVDAHLPAAELQKTLQAGLPLSGTLTLSPGEYRVRFIVRDNVSHKLGALSVPLKVEP